jgi:Di-haem oxidoreductase, putative peroxidase
MKTWSSPAHQSPLAKSQSHAAGLSCVFPRRGGRGLSPIMAHISPRELTQIMKTTLQYRNRSTAWMATFISAAALIGASPTSWAQQPSPPHKAPAARPRPINRLTQQTPAAQGTFGAPLPGLTTSELSAFGVGLDEFLHVEDVDGGLGPIFNNVSCVSCHGSPATGGGSAVTVTRFGKLTATGFDPLDSLGGSLLQLQAIHPSALEIVPTSANVTTQRQSTALFGMGLVEAIPDAVIVQGANRSQPDGVRGRAHLVTDVVSGKQRVGRFGWKAQQATVLAFSGDAYLNEMGVTNRFFPTENAPNGNQALLAAHDTVADPEDTPDPATGKSDIDVVADYMRLLAPPPTKPLTTEAQAGQRLFAGLGCAVCHTPSLQSGPSSVAAISFKPIALYSDLLLHDMGSLGDGIAQGQAGPRDFKTAPLWGLRASAPYLHDGRARTIDAAITAHEGEGKVAKDRYLKLSVTQQQQLAAFLGSI